MSTESEMRTWELGARMRIEACAIVSRRAVKVAPKSSCSSRSGRNLRYNQLISKLEAVLKHPGSPPNQHLRGPRGAPEGCFICRHEGMAQSMGIRHSPVPFALCLLGTACAASAPPPKAADCVRSAELKPADNLDTLSEEELVDKLMAQTGMAKLGQQMMDAMLTMTDLPPGFADKLRERLEPEELIAKIRPIYLRHYDRATLVASIRFNESPAGKRILAEMPQVTSEAMVVGQKWGQEVAAKVIAESKSNAAAKP